MAQQKRDRHYCLSLRNLHLTSGGRIRTCDLRVMRGTTAGLSASCEITVTSYGAEGKESASKPRETLLSLHLFHPSAEDCVRLRVITRAGRVRAGRTRVILSKKEYLLPAVFRPQAGHQMPASARMASARPVQGFSPAFSPALRCPAAFQ